MGNVYPTDFDLVEEQCSHCYWWRSACTHPEAEDDLPVEDCALFQDEEEEWVEPFSPLQVKPKKR